MNDTHGRGKINIRAYGFIIIAAILLYTGYGIELTYFKLHFFILLPIFGLAFLPPVPLKEEPREVKIIGYTFPFIIAVCAIIFSTFWDNYVASKGVWTFDRSEMVAVIGHIPLEEYFWFVDHTLLASLWTLSLWRSRDKTHSSEEQFGTASRITGTAICIILTIIGISMLNIDKMFFIAVCLSFFCPVTAVLWWFGGQYFIRHGRITLLGVTMPTVYLLLIDAWSVREGVWAFSDKYITGVKLFGITDWSQIMIHLWPTIAVVLPMIIIMSTADKISDNLRDRGDDSIARVVLKSLIG